MNLLLVVSTFPDKETARQIGTTMVEAQLAACVNLLPSIESIYRWKGAIESDTETLAIFKTTTDRYPDFEAMLTRLHPYDVPEVVAIEPAQASAAYTAWAVNETRPSPSNGTLKNT